ALERTAIARPASETPSGVGVGAGRLVRLEELTESPKDGDVVAVVGEQDFEAAAAALVDARDRGWRIAAAIVPGDDAVLIGNRFDRALPIADEVVDAARLPIGSLAAVEVAEAGASIGVLSDPLRLGLLLGFGAGEARAARTAARAVAGCRAAIVVRTELAQDGRRSAEASVVLVAADGAEHPLDEQAEPPLPGQIKEIRGAAGDRAGLLDLVWRRLPSPADDPGFARRLARRRAVALALLARGGSEDLVAALEEQCRGGARVVARESDAAMLGAATTPGSGSAPFVLDLGGGTVDLHTAEGAVSTAGGGDLVTRICAGLLGSSFELAERAKRHRSARVETPFTLHHEDGSRTFLGEPAPPSTLARLCAIEGSSLVPLPPPLAPEIWHGLRRAAKRDVLGGNLRRALDAVGGLPRSELLLLVGGCATDGEVLDLVAAEVEDRDLAIARGNILGRHGPRAAVAAGLVLSFVRGGAR
ncbi:MAG TPA: diol dehydratase reactivase ATPase-like domain-containing protein, partial [Gaiellaceae bacterium]|nr:diol dehydratase reactivase ATPase-like domain-containing protein [Gaiellaceae bacterium]